MDTRTVLIIEDNLAVLASYLQMFDDMNADIIPFVASTYETAQRIFSLERIDLIILDLVLPDVVCTEVLGDIRKKLSKVPILIVTGYPEMLDQEKAKEFSIAHLFTKPFKVEALSQAIRFHLSPFENHDVQ
jgi:two-component system, CitB family, response regulator DctR